MIMSFLDDQSLDKLSSCGKRFAMLILDDKLWKLKLDSEYQGLKYAFVNCRQSYKWHSRVTSRLPQLLKKKYNIYHDRDHNAISKMLLNMGPHNLNDMKIIVTFWQKSKSQYSCTDPILTFCFENSDSLLNNLLE
jgi:hypothetical protein